MKIMLKIWVLLPVFGSVVIAQNKYEPEYLEQDPNYDSHEAAHHPSNSRHQSIYEPSSFEEVPSNDPRHYQSLDHRYRKPDHDSYVPQPQHHTVPQPIQYHQPEDPSYHRPQEIVYQPSPHEYQPAIPQHQQSYQSSTAYFQPEEKKEDSKYAVEEPKYTQGPVSPYSSHPAPVPTDPKLPLFFTMYEKRVVADPTAKYGKGPWRYLTYGHGITYGSKEPGKVFEKGYGYIRALGRDHCKLPEHLCPPRDEKPFDYDGRKEPYFGYRPH